MRIKSIILITTLIALSSGIRLCNEGEPAAKGVCISRFCYPYEEYKNNMCVVRQQCYAGEVKNKKGHCIDPDYLEASEEVVEEEVVEEQEKRVDGQQVKTNDTTLSVNKSNVNVTTPKLRVKKQRSTTPSAAVAFSSRGANVKKKVETTKTVTVDSDDEADDQQLSDESVEDYEETVHHKRTQVQKSNTDKNNKRVEVQRSTKGE